MTVTYVRVTVSFVEKGPALLLAAFCDYDKRAYWWAARAGVTLQGVGVGRVTGYRSTRKVAPRSFPSGIRHVDSQHDQFL